MKGITCQFSSDVMVDGCGSNWIPNWLPFFQQKLRSRIDKFVQDELQERFAENQNLKREIPQSFSPMEDLYVQYRITGMVWKGEETVMFKANAAVSTTVNGKNQTYPPRGTISDTELAMDWPMYASKDDQSHLLQGLNISTEFFSRLVNHAL